jgi:hypothetical protein
VVRHSEIISFLNKKSQISSNQHQVKLSNTKVTNSLDGEEKTKSKYSRFLEARHVLQADGELKKRRVISVLRSCAHPASGRGA